MSTQTALLLNNVTGPISLPQCRKSAVQKMDITDPALNAMTDFTKNSAFSIEQDATIEYALLYMKAIGVRLLFVLDDDCRPVGLITSYDIQGEKPIRYLQSIGCSHKTCTRSDVLVRNIMSPVSQWVVINYADAEKVRISQVIDVLKSAGTRHLIVMENLENPSENIIRGIFSASHIERSTSISLEIVSTANSFAEIKHVISNS